MWEAGVGYFRSAPTRMWALPDTVCLLVLPVPPDHPCILPGWSLPHFQVTEPRPSAATPAAYPLLLSALASIGSRAWPPFQGPPEGACPAMHEEGETLR